MINLDQMPGSELAAITLTNENRYYLDSFSHLRFDRIIGSSGEPINTITFHVEQPRQVQRQEIKRMGLLNPFIIFQVIANKRLSF